MARSTAAGSRSRASTAILTGPNPKSLSGEELGSEAGVDAGSEALSAQRAFAGVGFEDVDGGVTDDGQVEWGVVLARAAAIFVEDHVQRPMQAVFDAPMGARRLQDGLWVGAERGDVEP